MGRIGIVATLCATACLTGCFTLDSSAVLATGERHVVVSNYGWYLFNFIPLVGGNAEPDSTTPFSVFRNDVTMEKIQKRFMDYSADIRMTPRDLIYHTSESVLFEIPGTSLPLPLPYLITYREIQLTGVLE